MATLKEYYTGKTWRVSNMKPPTMRSSSGSLTGENLVLVGQKTRIQEMAGGKLRFDPVEPFGDGQWGKFTLTYNRNGTLTGTATNKNQITITRNTAEDGNDGIHCLTELKLALEDPGEWDAEDDGG